MLENFDPAVTQHNFQEEQVSTPMAYMNWSTSKHRKPKGKKKTRKALEKKEVECDQLKHLNGQLTHENEMLKRAIMLAIAANRRKLDDDLADDALRVLPPKRNRRG